MTDQAPLTAPDLGGLLEARLVSMREALAQALDRGPIQVYGVLDFASARPSLKVPCVGALVLRDRAPGSPVQPDTDDHVVQRITTRVAVLAGVSAVGDTVGRKGRARDALRPLVGALRGAVLGWTPDGPFRAWPGDGLDAAPATTWTASRWSPLVLVGGQLLGLAENRAWWQDEYETVWTLRSAPPETPAIQAPESVCVSVNGADPVPV